MSCAEMIGVLMDREAFMISFIRGTPRVMSDTIKNDYQHRIALVLITPAYKNTHFRGSG